MTPKAAAAQERDRIIAWLRFLDIAEHNDEAEVLAERLACEEHWDRWDDLDSEGQQPPGTKDPYA